MKFRNPKLRIACYQARKGKDTVAMALGTWVRNAEYFKEELLPIGVFLEVVP